MAVAAMFSAKNCLNLSSAAGGLSEVVEAELRGREFSRATAAAFSIISVGVEPMMATHTLESRSGGRLRGVRFGYSRSHRRNRVSYRAVGWDANAKVWILGGFS